MSLVSSTKPVQYNEQQAEAIAHRGPPLLVVAGAGSGKTATLIGRVGSLLKEGVKPEEILMLTFTNKAARNMVERISKLGVVGTENLVAGTFHSIAYRFLCQEGVDGGFFRRQGILGEYQTKRIWEKAYGTVSQRTKSILYKWKLGGIRELQSWYSQKQTGQLSIEELCILKPLAAKWEEIQPGILKKCFDFYEASKKELHGIDFDDVLILGRKMLTFPDLLKKIRRKFKYIMVDEYQDTSRLQADFLKLIAGDGTNLVVVGDPKQSIYKFLSADIRNITKFKEEYANAKEIKLLINYRSQGSILQFSNQILKDSKEVENYQLQGNQEAVIKPHIHKYGSDAMEARGLLRDIKARLDAGIPPDEIAVLTRLSSLTYSLELALTEAKIPYVKVGGMKLLNKLNIRQFVAFLEVILNRSNWLAWETIFPMIPLIGKELSEQLVEDFKGIDTWTWQAPPPVSLGSGKRYQAFKAFWSEMKKVENLKDLPLQEGLNQAFEIFSTIYRVYFAEASKDEQQGILPNFGANDDDDTMGYGSGEALVDDRLGEIKEYIVNLTNHRTEFLQNFLDQFKIDDTLNQVQEEKKLILSTIHSAKGLEWNTVFVIGIEAGNLPMQGKKYGTLRANAQYDQPIEAEDESQEDPIVIEPYLDPPYLEEERRLFYVACTRAKQELHLCVCSPRRGQGLKESPFIKHLKPKGAAIGTIEGDLALLTVEKMRTEDEIARQSGQYHVQNTETEADSDDQP